MNPCACGCGEMVQGNFKRGHRLRVAGVAHDVGSKGTAWGRKGSDHSRWKGGTRIKRGYRFLWRPDNPMADRYGYVAEHRLVAAAALDRMLTTADHVHHINHDKLDNRPENLVVLSRSEHVRIHPRNRLPGWVKWPNGCRDCGTKDRKHRGNGYCGACYERRRRAGLPTARP